MQSQFRTSITAIGNSKGIRLPKALVTKLNTDEVILEVLEEGILIRPVRKIIPAEEWYAIMEKMQANGEIVPDDDLDVWDETVSDGIEDEEDWWS